MRITEELLRELALLEVNERTILSVYVDLRLGWERAEELFEREAARLEPALTNDEREFFQVSMEFFREFFVSERDEGFHGPGFAYFSDLGAGYSRGIELTTYPKALLAIDDQAIILPLALELDEFEPVGVIMADASGARILISAGNILDEGDSIRTKIHHLSKVGGWSQMRYQRRRDKQIGHFARDVADAADRIFRAEKVNRILMAGRDRILTSIEEELPKKWRDAIIDTIRWELNSSDNEFVRKIAPSLIEAERKQESEILGRFIGEYRRDGLAVAGAERTLAALRLGQVDILILDTDLDAELTEELTSLAEACSAYVEFIPAQNPTMSQFGGVGALLRYRTD